VKAKIEADHTNIRVQVEKIGSSDENLVSDSGISSILFDKVRDANFELLPIFQAPKVKTRRLEVEKYNRLDLISHRRVT